MRARERPRVLLESLKRVNDRAPPIGAERYVGIDEYKNVTGGNCRAGIS